MRRRDFITLIGGTATSFCAAPSREPNGGLIMMADSFLNAHRAEITSLVARYRLPAIYPYRLFTEAGGLLS
jgi:putative ABC transport system substrate-binding protein